MSGLFIPVFGTWGRDGTQWWQDGSAVLEFFAVHGLLPVRDEDGTPFRWSGNLDGQLGWLRMLGLGFLLKGGGHNNWRACGDALSYFMDDDVPYEARNLLVHSHGLQGALYCAAGGRKIRRLVSMGSPYRKDMGSVILQARPNIEEWIHVMDGHWDRIGQLGQFGDGTISFNREHPAADFNVKFDGVSHSRMLNDPEVFGLWQSLIDPECAVSLVQFLAGASVRELSL